MVKNVLNVSPVFITPKSDGGHGLILNLKRFNDAVFYQHFKMDSIKTVLQLITPNCYMCKVDLKEAYYSVKVDENYQRFLKFTWRDQLYKYVCLPNGLASCPRRFPKLSHFRFSVCKGLLWQDILMIFLPQLHIMIPVSSR